MVHVPGLKNLAKHARLECDDLEGCFVLLVLNRGLTLNSLKTINRHAIFARLPDPEEPVDYYPILCFDMMDAFEASVY